jgi:hypothetical protein
LRIIVASADGEDASLNPLSAAGPAKGARHDEFTKPLSKSVPPGRHCASLTLRLARTMETTMQYMLLIRSNEDEMKSASREVMENMFGAYQAYTKAMIDAGVMKHGAPLQPGATATTVRARGGQNQVLDGPYAEAKEQLGGYYMIDVPTLDDALAWAARCPGAAVGSIEVRPIMEMPMPA